MVWLDQAVYSLCNRPLQSMCSSAGSILFNRRRWLDPNVAEDRRLLLQVGLHNHWQSTHSLYCMLLTSIHPLQHFAELQARFPDLLVIDEPSFIAAITNVRV